MKKTEQYQCKSYFEGTELLDCTCGKCAKPTKKRGRPIGSKKKVELYKNKDEMYSTEDAIKKVNKIMKDWVMPTVKNKKPFLNIYEHETENYIKELEKRSKEMVWDAELDEIEVPTLRRIREPKMSLVNKVTWVLTAVNIAILISLVIKNL